MTRCTCHDTLVVKNLNRWFKEKWVDVSRKDKDGNWLIINIIVNGVNLGLTFRNQFQALAKEHNENIDEIIKHWTSDADLN